jgi:hypothetical protein
MDMVVKLLMGVGFILASLAILLMTFACRPITASWDILSYMVPERKCIDAVASLMSISILHVIFNILLLILPIRVIWGVQLPLRVRVSLTLLFCFGGLACIFSIIRMMYIKTSFNSYDFSCKYPSYGGVMCLADRLLDNHLRPVIYGQLEVTLALILSSLPALNFLLVNIMPSRFRKTTQGSSSKSTGNKASTASKDEHILLEESKGGISVTQCYEVSRTDLESDSGRC